MSQIAFTIDFYILNVYCQILIILILYNLGHLHKISLSLCEAELPNHKDKKTEASLSSNHFPNPDGRMLEHPTLNRDQTV